MVVEVSGLFGASNVNANQRGPTIREKLGALPIFAHVFH